VTTKTEELAARWSAVMMSNYKAPPVALALSLSGCGGGGGPTSPSGPPTPSVPTYSVTATVFYDQNRNGQLDAGENTRIPGVDVVIGPGTGKSAAGTGQAVVSGVTEGAQTVALRTDSLPTYFQPESQLSVQVPAASEVRIPLTLPIGNNSANVYLGYGDSITYGDGSSDRQGYVQKLQNLLGPYLGRAEVRSWGRPGSNSSTGEDAMRVTMGWFNPAYVLILYGTAVVDETGAVRFFEDIYGQDASLEKVLNKGYPYPN